MLGASAEYPLNCRRIRFHHHTTQEQWNGHHQNVNNFSNNTEITMAPQSPSEWGQQNGHCINEQPPRITHRMEIVINEEILQ
jgi:hypothetical protein